MHIQKTHSLNAITALLLVILPCAVAPAASEGAQSATIVVSVTPDAAPWTLAGPDGSAVARQRDQTLAVAPGQYTVAWGEMADSHALPVVASLSGTAQEGQTLTFDGVYRAAKPIFYPDPGLYGAACDVTICCNSTDSVIYYTTDGSTPTTSSIVYSAPLHIATRTTINAIAIAGGLGDSDVATGVYRIDLQPPLVTLMATNPTRVRGGVDLSAVLTATASDAGRGDTNVIAAWCFVGADPGEGYRTPMLPVDGNFDSPTEAVTAAIDTSGWVVGRSYPVSVIARDEAAQTSAPATVSVSCVGSDLPMVTAYTDDAAAAEPAYQSSGRDTGKIVVSRTGSTASPLVVTVSMGGTAANGMDYSAIGPAIVIAAGASSASVEISPVGDTLTEGCETVTLSIVSGNGYCATVPESALVTIADSGPSGPMYSFAASDSESSGTSTAWASKTLLSFKPTVADDWVVFAFVEYTSSNTSLRTHVRLIQDGTVQSEAGSRPVAPGDYISFVTAWKTTLAAAQHKISLDFSVDAGATACVRNAKIVAVRKAALEAWSAPSPPVEYLDSTLRDWNTLTWTPASQGDYLLIWSTEWCGQPGYNTRLQAKLNGEVYDDATAQAAGARDSYSFVNFSKVSCTTKLQTMSIAASRDAGSPEGHRIRHCRLIAIRLTGSRLTGAVGASSSSEWTSASTAFATKLTKSWTWGTNVNWLLLTSFNITGSNTLYSTEARSTINDAIVSGQPMRMPTCAGSYMSAGAVDARFLSTSAHTDVAFRATNKAYTAKIKYIRFVALPLD